MKKIIPGSPASPASRVVTVYRVRLFTLYGRPVWTGCFFSMATALTRQQRFEYLYGMACVVEPVCKEVV